MPRVKPGELLTEPEAPQVTFTDPCHFTPNADGSGVVTIYLEPAIMKRLSTRIGPANPGIWLWENILKRTIHTSVF